jgi:hypothetical protein
MQQGKHGNFEDTGEGVQGRDRCESSESSRMGFWRRVGPFKSLNIVY